MTDTTNLETEVEVTNPAQDIEADATQGQDETRARARDDKGRFAREEGETPDADNEGEPEIDPALLEALDEQPTDEELEEVAWKEKKAKVPKWVKDAMLMNDAFTQKTQKLSEEKRTLTAEIEQARAKLQQQEQDMQAEFEERAQIHTLKQYLDQFKAIDWNKAMEEDPVEANKQFIQFHTLNGELQKREKALTDKASERALNAQREAARRREEGRDALSREIRGWSPKVEADLRAYAKSLGAANADSFDFEMSPLEARILHKAYTLDQLMSRSAKPKPKAPEPKPTKTVGQSAASTNALRDDLPMDEWKRRWLAKQARNP